LKALRITGIVFAALVVLALSVFAWAVYTESGARSILALSRRWLPAGLTVETLSGTVAGTLRVHHLRYRDTRVGMDLFVEDADALHAEYAAQGVEFTRGVANMPWQSREFVVKDCDGRLLAFGANL